VCGQAGLILKAQTGLSADDVGYPLDRDATVLTTYALYLQQLCRRAAESAGRRRRTDYE
jgi:hypothetical protein